LDKLQSLNAQNFDQVVLDSETPVIVDFWADWCVPCKSMEPMLEEMSDLMGGKLRFAKVDVDQHRELAIRYEVKSLPTLLIFEKGRPVDTISGVPPRYSLISRLEKHL
jgi:thioredoxin 1